jgi:hypothetical protein
LAQNCAGNHAPVAAPGHISNTQAEKCTNGGWTAWSALSLCSRFCDGGKKYQNRACTNPAPTNGGTDCSGSSTYSEDCNTHSCGHNGGWSNYGAWNACSVQCGGGKKYRYRSCNNPAPSEPTIRAQCEHRGTVCKALGQGATCGAGAGVCSCASGMSLKSRRLIGETADVAPKADDMLARAISRAARNKGALRAALIAENVNDGSDFESTLAAKGGGINIGIGGGIIAPVLVIKSCYQGGAACTASDVEEATCNEDACPIDGGWSDFGAYGSCSKTCGGGTKSRTRTCNNPAPAHGGSSCSGLSSESTGCNSEECAIDCTVAYWGSWSDCTKTCGGGSQRRTRALTEPSHGGKACPTHYEDRSCNDSGCPSHCATSEFSAWTACTKSCGDGVQSRSRSVTGHAANGGYECPYLKETRTCNSQSCAVDGAVGAWSAWAVCTKSCGGGSQNRHRYVSVAPGFGGKAHAHLEETRACNAQSCPANCVYSAFSGAWGACSKTCAGGVQSRSRSMTQPRLGGASCPVSQETRTCNSHKCPIDCAVSPFSPWSRCTKSCGGGSQLRARAETRPFYGGKACPHFEETRACNTHACAINCAVPSWTAWSACSHPCGPGGVTKRTRAVVQPKNGGTSCPSSQEQKQCNIRDCPKKCTATKCSYGKVDGEVRTTIFHNNNSKETNGCDYHCGYVKGTKTWSVVGGASVTHTNECVCYCDHFGQSSIAHHGFTYKTGLKQNCIN